MHTAMILADLQKAFETLYHGILLEKMKKYSFQTSVMKQLKSDLSNRTFLICIEHFSESAILKCSVPQDSVLGLLLFLSLCK